MMTKHTNKPENKQQPKIIQSLFDESEQANKHATADLDDDDDGTQNFAVRHKSLIVIVKLLVSILNISRTI